MGDKTKIEWTRSDDGTAGATWNPTTGCDRISAGCDHCYALTMAKRLKGMGNAKYQTDGNPATSGPGFGLAMHESALDQPLRWTRPRRIFVNSMSDLFHKDVTDEFIARVFAVMMLAQQHTFQVLTKRHGRMRSLLSRPDFRDMVLSEATFMAHTPGRSPGLLSVTFERDEWWPLPNVWMGVSVENQHWADIRIPWLLGTPAAVRFLSMEPLLGPVVLDESEWLIAPEGCEPRGCCTVDWVIVGGESGKGARPMNPAWARSLRDQCTEAGVPFLFKQWGEWAPAPWHGSDGATHAFTGTRYERDGVLVDHFMELDHQPTSIERTAEAPPGAQGMRRVGKHKAGRVLDGRTWDEYPEAVTV